MTDTNEIDWSKGRFRDMLVYQRKMMWLDETIEKLAAWMRLEAGMTAIDVGCGLGYLGYTFWQYFGRGGRYHGVDKSTDLLKDAEDSAEEWVVGGQATFVQGSAYDLPFDDGYADWVMCQTLLMHLKDANRALAEMIRVAKPGGLVSCIEPNLLGAYLNKGFWSLPDFTLEEDVLLRKKAFICHEGRKKLGRGDGHIAPKIPHMMKELGLTDIDVRANDQIFYLEPPYEDELQRRRMEAVKKRIVNEENYNAWQEREKEEFFAGGGSEEDYERYKDIEARIRPMVLKQIENGEYYVCAAPHLYIIKGRK